MSGKAMKNNRKQRKARTCKEQLKQEKNNTKKNKQMQGNAKKRNRKQ